MLGGAGGLGFIFGCAWLEGRLPTSSSRALITAVVPLALGGGALRLGSSFGVIPLLGCSLAVGATELSARTMTWVSLPSVDGDSLPGCDGAVPSYAVLFACGGPLA